MGNNIAMPAVPSGLPRDLTMFLQAMAENMRILSGTARGQNKARAVRANENISQGQGLSIISNENIKDKSISSGKIADNAIIERVLAQGSVTSSKIADNAIIGAKIENGQISLNKLSAESVLKFHQGQADNTEIILPHIFTQALLLAISHIQSGQEQIGIGQLEKVLDLNGQFVGYKFIAQGQFTYIAIGY